MNKVNPSNGNETKADIFSLDIFKSGILFHWPQNWVQKGAQTRKVK